MYMYYGEMNVTLTNMNGTEAGSCDAEVVLLGEGYREGREGWMEGRMGWKEVIVAAGWCSLATHSGSVGGLCRSSCPTGREWVCTAPSTYCTRGPGREGGGGGGSAMAIAVWWSLLTAAHLRPVCVQWEVIVKVLIKHGHPSSHHALAGGEEGCPEVLL